MLNESKLKITFKQKNQIIIFIAVFLFSLTTGCVSVKSTFEEEYTRKLEVNPDKLVSLSPDGSQLLVAERNSGSFSLNYNNALSLVNTSDGSVIWTSLVGSMGEIGSDPINIEVLWDEGVILMISRSVSSYRMAAFDIQSQEQLWFKEGGQPAQVSFTGYHLSNNGSYLFRDNNGLQAFNLKTGKTIWQREDLTIDVDFGLILFGLEEEKDVEIIHLEVMDRFLISHNNKVLLLNPYTGQSDWELSADLGSVLLADIFEHENVAVFYGPQRGKRVSSALSALAGNAIVDAGARVARALETGIRDNPIFLVNLATGKIEWETRFKTNGSKKVLIYRDKLLITGLVTYAFDLASGNVIWQNVDEEILNDDMFLTIVAEFTGFDFSARSLAKPNDLVIDNTIFVVFPEQLDPRGSNNEVSVRRYNLDTGEQIWKSEPERITVRDFFLEQGRIFLIADGRFSTASNLLAYDPYEGEKLYHINTRNTFNKLVFGEEKIYQLDVYDGLFSYDIRNGDLVDIETLRGRVRDIADLGNELWVVYASGGYSGTIALHDKKTFRLIDQVDVPFYSQDHVAVDDKFFINYQSEGFKGILQLDLENMEVEGYTSALARWKKTENDRNVTLDPYWFFLDNNGEYVYKIEKGELTKFIVR
jgi:outer membrane protein assembly factor BamB